jgi:hypothetical protein
MNRQSAKEMYGQSASCPHCGNDDLPTLTVDSYQPDKRKTHCVCQQCGNLFKVINRDTYWHQAIKRKRWLLLLPAVFVGIVIGLFITKFLLGW